MSASTMHLRFEQFFRRSAAWLLVLTAFAKLYSAAGAARILSFSDPFLHVQHRVLMVAVALLEVATAACLFSGRPKWASPLALFWLSGNFIIYRIGASAMGVSYCHCLGTLGQQLPLSQQSLNLVLTGLVLYWFFGSGYLIWRERQAVETARLAALEPAR
jgi:hypothetical protein